MDLPLGFALALAQNPNSMYTFSNLPEAQQLVLLSQIQNINSKAEMHDFVEHLGKN